MDDNELSNTSKLQFLYSFCSKVGFHWWHMKMCYWQNTVTFSKKLLHVVVQSHWSAPVAPPGTLKSKLYIEKIYKITLNLTVYLQCWAVAALQVAISININIVSFLLILNIIRLDQRKGHRADLRTQTLSDRNSNHSFLCDSSNLNEWAS